MNTKLLMKALMVKLKFSMVLLLVAASPAIVDEASAAFDDSGSPVVIADIIVSFRLDPRLTASLYMGERWILGPPTYTSTLQTGGKVTVDVRAIGRDSKGKPMRILPEWIPADPEMVEITPGKKGVVTIVCKRPGESRLQVVAQGFVKELNLKAIDMGDGMQVTITNN